MICTLLALMSLGQAPPHHPPEHPVIPEFYRPPNYGPAYAELTLGERVQPRQPGATGEISLPFPNNYTGQVVVSVKVQCDPPDALKGWAWQPAADGLNATIKASVTPPPQGAWVSWTARVLLPDDAVTRTEIRQFAAWKTSGPIDPVLEAATSRAVNELHHADVKDADLPGETAMWVARYRQGWTHDKTHRAQPEPGTDSLNRALLCVAILQRMKVPARIVCYAPVLLGPAAYPLWLTEYPSEDGNWGMVDPTIGIKEPDRSSVLVLAIPPLSEEKRLLATLPGPQDALVAQPATVSPQLNAAHAPSDREMSVSQVEPFRWQANGRLMMAGISRSRVVMESARQGKDDWLDDAGLQEAMSKGPTGLALFLSGRPMFPGRPKG